MQRKLIGLTPGFWATGVVSHLGEYTMKKFVIAAAVVALSAGSAFAAGPTGNTSQATGSASASVVSPITVTHDTGAALSFGTFTAGTGGTVTVTAGGTASPPTGDVGLLSGGTASADAFTVAGDASRNFTISTAGGNVTSGTNSMAFTTSASATSGTLDATGAATFTVGGTLTVGSGQTPGSYTGSYTATVTYN
jgi:hypothetical protein